MCKEHGDRDHVAIKTEETNMKARISISED
jgi:hypothetical protein